mgnify:CR=1 FL=1
MTTCISREEQLQYELGFGSISLGKEFLPEFWHDHGFGAPYDVLVPADSTTPDVGFCYRNLAEEGFGDPLSELEKKFEKPPRINEGTGVEFSDNGGMLGILFTDFKNAFPEDAFANGEPVGPFKFFIRHRDTGEEHQLFSAIPGQGFALFSTTNQDKIYFALPFCAKGLYDFTTQWEREGVLRTFTLAKAIKILHRQRNDKTMSIRANLPEFWNAGPRSDNYISPDLYIPNETTNAVLTSMVGEVFNKLWFNDYTITKSIYTTDQTVLNVESTLGFPAKGNFIVDGLKVSYTGKTDTSFTGISGIDKIIHPTTRVHFDHQEFSEIDNYWKILNNNLYKPAYVIDNDSWLRAFNAIEFGEHVCWTVLFDYYLHLFDVVTYTRNMLLTGSKILSPTFQPADNDLLTNPTFLNRLVVIDGKVFKTLGLNGNGTGIRLDEMGCTYWNGAFIKGDFTKPVLTNDTNYDVKFLPFIIKQDHDGEFIFDLEESSLPSSAGFIDRDFIDFNIYFGGSEVGPETDLNLNKLLAAGIKGFLTRSLDTTTGSFWPTTFPSIPNPNQFYIEPDNVFDDQAP